MNSETSQSEDAALRRLLRELGTVAPPANFDARLRLRMERERPRRFDSLALSAASFAPRFAAACGLLVLLFAVHALRYSVTPDVVSSGANAHTLASGMTYAAITNDFDSATGTINIAEGRTPVSARRRAATRNASFRRVAIPSTHARVKRNSAYLGDDGGAANMEIASATIPVHVQSVSVVPRALDRGSETLLLNPVSFGGEPLASLAVNLTARRFAPMTQTEARRRDAETQSAW